MPNDLLGKVGWFYLTGHIIIYHRITHLSTFLLMLSTKHYYIKEIKILIPKGSLQGLGHARWWANGARYLDQTHFKEKTVSMKEVLQNSKCQTHIVRHMPPRILFDGKSRQSVGICHPLTEIYIACLTHLPLGKWPKYSDAYSWMKRFVFSLKFPWSLFTEV